MLLGVLIFIDDYFNCLTVGAVMRPVTESHHISRAKLAYLIDATAAPVCMIAPVSSWAAAVSGYVNSDSVSGIQMFIRQIPWNYYCLLTLLMIVVISVLNIDYGTMLTHEYNAQVKGDLFTTPERPFEGADDYEKPASGKSSVLDLLLPVVVLIAVCIISLITSGGYYDAESEYYHNFVEAFSNASSGPALALGGMIGCIFTFIYFWCRGAISFEKSFECVPQGFIQMIAPILILTFAWTLCSFTRFAMYSSVFVREAMAGAGSLKLFLPAVIFLIGAAIGFATGTSWGTIGIMAPIVVSVFDYDVEPILCTIGLAAACSGGVMGDHCSPISDTTIMASAGAHCFHLNHVFTQIPYALTVTGVSFVSFILAGLIQNVVINLIIAVALMIGTLLVIKAIVSSKHAGIFSEMVEANKSLAHQESAPSTQLFRVCPRTANGRCICTGHSLSVFCGGVYAAKSSLRAASLSPKEPASADPTVDVGPVSQASKAGRGAERSESLFPPKGHSPFGRKIKSPDGFHPSGRLLLCGLSEEYDYFSYISMSFCRCS